MKTPKTKNFAPIGHRRWVIPDGWIPPTSHGPKPAMLSHDAACVLNVSDREAHLEFTVFYSDREPVGPYKITVSARRAKHLRFNDFNNPEPIPIGTDYASLIESNVPVIVQYTRLDSRQSENALMTTMAFADTESAV